MKNILLFSTILSLTLLFSCNNSGDKKVPEATAKTYDELKKASWLIGKWEYVSGEGHASETWEAENDSTYAGRSYFLVGKDTVSSESLVLTQSGNELHYIPTVKEQNQGQPVKFTMTGVPGNQLVFVNPQHDFPQKITYTKITEDSIVAEISGMMDGKAASQQFPLKRLK
jgi:hypothetical protein